MSDYPEKANSVTYEGRVYFKGQSAELRHIQAGNAVCDASMRVSKKFGQTDDDWESVWLPITAWDDAAVTLSKVPHKGEVIVTGRLSVKQGFTTRAGEEVPTHLAIVATEVQPLDEPAGVGAGTSDAWATPGSADTPF